MNLNIESEQELREFMRDLRRLDPEVVKDLRKELRDVLRTTALPRARARASWSSRIPGAIQPMVQGKRLGLRVASKRAPHARPFEGLQAGLRSRGGSFRHPVFGNRQNWVSQMRRPFLAPAMVESAPDAVKGAEKAIETAARRVGWS